MAAHQLLQKRQPIHARHLDVECQDVGFQLQDFFSCDIGIAGRSHNLEFGVGAKYLGEQLAHQRGIIDNKHLEQIRHT